MISTLIFLLILGLLIIVHEFGHLIAAKKMGVRVERFSIGFGPQLLTRKRNDTEYSISLIPLGGYVKLAGDNPDERKGEADEYLAQPPGKRAAIVFFGPLLNYILGFLFFWLVFFVGYPTLTTKVGTVLDGFGAKEAGIVAQDRIISIDENTVKYWEDLQGIIRSKNPDAVVTITVLRDNKEYNFKVKIKPEEVSDLLGEKRRVGILGITPEGEMVSVKHGFIQSFFMGMEKTWELTALTFKALARLITGKLAMRESMTGPLGIFYITSKAAEVGIIALLHLVAALSVSLAIFNLLPIPVLDGGHIFFLALEKIRGKSITPKTEKIITQIGLSAIITLAVFVTYNDVVRFFGERIVGFFKK